MRRVIFWLITFTAILGACLTLPSNSIPNEYAMLMPPNDILNSRDAIAAGDAIFQAKCAECHGVFGDGKGIANLQFGLKPVDLTAARTAALLPQYLFWRVSEGGRVEPFRSRGSIMPAWKYQLSETERWQVIAYIRTLGK